jgi:hypothetical protein
VNDDETPGVPDELWPVVRSPEFETWYRAELGDARILTPDELPPGTSQESVYRRWWEFAVREYLVHLDEGRKRTSAATDKVREKGDRQRVKARRLRAKGHKIADIATTLQVTQTQVYRLLKD